MKNKHAGENMKHLTFVLGLALIVLSSTPTLSQESPEDWQKKIKQLQEKNELRRKRLQTLQGVSNSEVGSSEQIEAVREMLEYHAPQNKEIENIIPDLSDGLTVSSCLDEKLGKGGGDKIMQKLLAPNVIIKFKDITETAGKRCSISREAALSYVEEKYGNVLQSALTKEEYAASIKCDPVRNQTHPCDIPSEEVY